MGLLSWLLQTPAEFEAERRAARRVDRCWACGGWAHGGVCLGPHRNVDRERDR